MTKKIHSVISSCMDCKYSSIYMLFNPKKTEVAEVNNNWAVICQKKEQIISLSSYDIESFIGKAIRGLKIPDWCPLEDYTENNKTE